MNAGEAITLWTIRLSLALYAATLAGQLTIVPPSSRVLRGLWTAGCVLLVAHIAAAFHYYHAWDHADAVESTARQTQQAIGRSFGGGIYFNYVFAGVWLGEVALWWLAPTAFERRPRWLAWAVQGFMAFMVFNAVIVFEEGATRWCGVVVALVLVALGVRKWQAMRREGIVV